ncbi:MAG: FAD-dependent oxidoreductase [Candidatus Eisenbacteria bacterium]|nr:FAD-dependent oxidoreductase [Candidatus Eisenbacteria bacterium]
MNGNAAPWAAGALELQGRGLLVPTLQSEPLPVRAIDPSPCTAACPAGINVKAYVSLIAERRFAEALEVVRRRCPLPGICGRVCHHPCENACKRGHSDEPIAIRALKRVVADRERDFPRPAPPPGPTRSGRVAIVGSGPAGLTAAYDLALAGYPVTVFEADSEPGGMLRYGIADYRLPPGVLDAEIGVLQRAGVEIRTGMRLGRDLDLEGLRRDGYSATLLAVGAQIGRPLSVPGEESCPVVEDALRFLRRVNSGSRTFPGNRVVVIGGGSTAVEAARTALRLGAKSVEVVYRRYREELLASRYEIEAAEREGVNFSFLVAPSRVLLEGQRLAGLECMKVGLGEPDGSGRRRPILIPGSEFVVQADRVLAAVGQEADLDFLDPADRERASKGGRLPIDERTALTALPGVFAAGDVVTGPATVIEAIAAGHRAAESIRHHIEEGRPDIREERPERAAAAEYELPDQPPIRAARLHPAQELPAPGREFGEVEAAFEIEDAVAEARRCLRCGPCGDCRVCAPTCQRRHIMVRAQSPNGNGTGRSALVRAPGNVAMALDSASATPGWLLQVLRPGTLPEIRLSDMERVHLRPVRTRIEANLCRGCARCVDVCPFKAVHLEASPGRAGTARIEQALCRGCNLCATVCPTKAARPSALSPQWWGSRLEDAFHPGADGSAPGVHVVLACQRRAGGLEGRLAQPGTRVEVIRFQCVGQVDVGMLLDLYRLGARRVMVAGCSLDRCRFGQGAGLAAQELERARAMLKLLGAPADLVVWEESERRARDPLGPPVAAMTHGEAAPRPQPGAASRGGGE